MHLQAEVAKYSHSNSHYLSKSTDTSVKIKKNKIKKVKVKVLIPLLYPSTSKNFHTKVKHLLIKEHIQCYTHAYNF